MEVCRRELMPNHPLSYFSSIWRPVEDCRPRLNRGTRRGSCIIPDHDLADPWPGRRPSIDWFDFLRHLRCDVANLLPGLVALGWRADPLFKFGDQPTDRAQAEVYRLGRQPSILQVIPGGGWDTR